jgi:hypothetical protein
VYSVLVHYGMQNGMEREALTLEAGDTWTAVTVHLLRLTVGLKTDLPNSHLVKASYLLIALLHFNKNKQKIVEENTVFLRTSSLIYGSHTLTQIKSNDCINTPLWSLHAHCAR